MPGHLISCDDEFQEIIIEFYIADGVSIKLCMGKEESREMIEIIHNKLEAWG